MANIGAVESPSSNALKQQNNVETAEKQNVARGGKNQDSSTIEKAPDRGGEGALRAPQTTGIDSAGISSVLKNGSKQGGESLDQGAEEIAKQNSAQQTQRGQNIDESA